MGSREYNVAVVGAVIGQRFGFDLNKCLQRIMAVAV
jgi:hypothetical protein